MLLGLFRDNGKEMESTIQGLGFKVSGWVYISIVYVENLGTWFSVAPKTSCRHFSR